MNLLVKVTLWQPTMLSSCVYLLIDFCSMTITWRQSYEVLLVLICVLQGTRYPITGHCFKRIVGGKGNLASTNYVTVKATFVYTGTRAHVGLTFVAFLQHTIFSRQLLSMLYVHYFDSMIAFLTTLSKPKPIHYSQQWVHRNGKERLTKAETRKV